MHLLAETHCKFRRFFSFTLFLFCFTTSYANQELIVEPDRGSAPLINAIKDANHTIDLVMYGFTDTEFSRALITAKDQGKIVRVLLQHHPYKADDENDRIIAALQKANINLVWPDANFELTHQKTFLFDNHSAWVMTFNLTNITFQKERNFALVITDPAMLQEIENVYDADWQHKKIRVKNADLIWSPDNSRTRLLALISGAKSEIKMYVESLTDYQIVGALAEAARHGVTVRIITSLERNKEPGKQLNYLSKAGVVLSYSHDYIIHAKVMIIDDTTAVIGSINMTRASINQNRELSVISHEPMIIRELNKTFEADWV